MSAHSSAGRRVSAVDTLLARRVLVRIDAIVVDYDQYSPWRMRPPERGGGSGCIVRGNKILTAAHVVANAQAIRVAHVSDSDYSTARICGVDHERDLAVLTVDDPTFFANVTPMIVCENRQAPESATMYGFISEQEIEVVHTKISHMSVANYQYSRRDLLVLDLDRPVVAGMSGGPLVAGGLMVGMALQTTDYPDRVAGQAVPSVILTEFLAGVEAGAVKGVAELGIHWQAIRNSDLSMFLGLGPSPRGVLISEVIVGSTVDGHLEKDDVLLAVDGAQIRGDGSCVIPEIGHQVHFSAAVSLRRVGDRVELEFVRAGVTIHISVELREQRSLVALPCPTRAPSYVIFAGLVLVRLTSDYLSLWSWSDIAFRFKHLMYDCFPAVSRRQVVLLHRVLPHAGNVGYQEIVGAEVVEVNGSRVDGLDSVVAALRIPVGRFHVLKLANVRPHAADADPSFAFGNIIAIAVDEAAAITSDILREHQIGRTCSRDLDEWVNEPVRGS